MAGEVCLFAAEKGVRVGRRSGAPRDALSEARTIQMEASRLGFDWEEVGAVLAKVREEVREIEAALAAGDAAHARKEVGDLLFSAVIEINMIHSDRVGNNTAERIGDGIGIHLVGQTTDDRHLIFQPLLKFFCR